MFSSKVKEAVQESCLFRTKRNCTEGTPALQLDDLAENNPPTPSAFLQDYGALFRIMMSQANSDYSSRLSKADMFSDYDRAHIINKKLSMAAARTVITRLAFTQDEIARFKDKPVRMAF